MIQNELIVILPLILLFNHLTEDCRKNKKIDSMTFLNQDWRDIRSQFVVRHSPKINSIPKQPHELHSQIRDMPI
jgi:hypothetical protein